MVSLCGRSTQFFEKESRLWQITLTQLAKWELGTEESLCALPAMFGS